MPSLAISTLIAAFAAQYQQCGIIYSLDASRVPHKSDYIYFSIITWTSLGYGDFVPAESCRLWAAGEAIAGYLAMALFVLAAVSTFSSKSVDKSEGEEAAK